MGEFHYDRDDNGVVTITMDMDGPVNSMNDQFWGLYSGAMDRIEATEGLTGVIWTSAKDTFFAGGDLNMLRGVDKDGVGAVFEAVEGAKAVMRRQEKLGVPTVAAINGAALGGGLEICLACHRRIAADNPKTKLGLPEVTLGLLPGGGGVVRMTWLLGLEAAMPYLLEGRQVNPGQALKAGIIDEVVPAGDLAGRAKDWISSVQGDAAACTQPWDTKGYRIPGGPSSAPANMALMAGAAAKLFKQTQGLLPGPRHILDIMTEAAGKLDFDTATRYESRRFVALLPLATTKNMISTLFFAKNKVNGGAGRPKGVPPSTVAKLGIVGAGKDGRSLAFLAAMAGVPVVLKDTQKTTAERGKAHVANRLKMRVDRRRMTAEQARTALELILATDAADDLNGCDLIVGAGPDTLADKTGALAGHQGLLAHDGIWASLTATLPTTRLAHGAARPENVIGLHFLQPMEKLALVEIVVGERTSEETAARAFDFARRIGKMAIVVGDVAGFFTSRILGAQIIEALELIGEGHDPQRIDNLTRIGGMPVGVLSAMDDVDIGLMMDIHDALTGARPDSKARALLSEAKAARQRVADPTIGSALAALRDPAAVISDTDIQERILFRAVIESLKCLQAGVLRNVADGNVATLLGSGAPVHTGGYIQFVNTYGPDRFVARCEELAGTYGDRFAPPGILRSHAAQGKAFA